MSAQPASEAGLAFAAPMEMTIQGWDRDLQRRGVVNRVKIVGQVRRMAKGCGWSTLADATPAQAIDYISSKDWSAGSKCNAQTALVSLLEYCVATRELDVNWAKGIPRPRADSEESDASRPLTLDEVKRLLAAAIEAEKDGRCRGCSRAMFYEFSTYTALRWGTMRQLQVRMVNLASTPPRLEIPPQIIKRRKGRSLPLIEPAARIAVKLCAGRDPFDRLFSTCPTDATFEKDLGRAKIPIRDHRGKKATPHSLRKASANICAELGVPQRVVQWLLGHADGRLTSEIYQSAELMDLSRHLGRFPSLSGVEDGEIEQKPVDKPAPIVDAVPVTVANESPTLQSRPPRDAGACKGDSCDCDKRGSASTGPGVGDGRTKTPVACRESSAYTPATQSPEVAGSVADILDGISRLLRALEADPQSPRPRGQ